MWKMVVSDLCYEFKPGLKKAFKKFINWYSYLYLLGMAPILLHISSDRLLCYYFAIVPMILAAISFTIYSGRPSKAFYLCPLSTAQREQYFLISWGIRAGVPSLLSLLLESALFLVGKLSLITALVMIASNIFLSMMVNLRGNTKDLGGEDKRFAYYDLWNALALGLGMFVIIFLSAIIDDIETPRFTDVGGGLILVLFFFDVLATLVIIVKYFHPVMEKMIEYEEEIKGGGI